MPDWETVLIRGERYVVGQCGVCGTRYVVPEAVHAHHYEEGGFAFCPNGHKWGWREGHRERDALRLERDRLKQDAARLEEEMAAERRRAAAAEAKLQQLRKRTAAGVCPCCNRTFQQLARHMQSKHPDVPFVPAKRKA